MQRILLETRIAAPARRCFLLSLSIDLHQASATATGERAVAGVTHGIIGRGESVTFRGRHFGLWLKHESCITAYEEPVFFVDTMTRGMFRSFVHQHTFLEVDQTHTLMRDELVFEAPAGLLGRMVERLILRDYLRRFLEERNEVIRKTAESPEAWKSYLASS